MAGRGRGLGGEEGAWSVAGRGRAGRWRGRLAMMSAHQHQHCVSAIKAKNCTTLGYMYRLSEVFVYMYCY